MRPAHVSGNIDRFRKEPSSDQARPASAMDATSLFFLLTGQFRGRYQESKQSVSGTQWRR